MLRTASSLPLAGLLTLGSGPARFQAEPPACYRASWQLPGPDFHRQATTSLRTRRNTMALRHGVTSRSAGRTKKVQWCICGPIVPALAGCWNVSLFINPIDGVGPTRGALGAPKTAQVDSVPVTSVPGPESFQRCYLVRFDFAGGTVAAGVYDLLATLTLSTGSCAAPGPLLGDTLGYAEIPVLVFFAD